MSDCEKYSVENDQWTPISNMNRLKSNASACILNNKFIYILGGKNEDAGILNEIEKYEIDKEYWKFVQIKSSQRLSPRINVLSFQIDTYCILIAGGKN